MTSSQSSTIYKKLLKLNFKKLSSDLNITDEFITSLHDEKNSWSFISKLAQFIEAVFTRSIVIKLNEPDIFPSVSNFTQATRINLCRELKLINKEQSFLFLSIAEIRNKYIHNIANIDVDLTDYLKTLHSQKKTELFNKFKPFLVGEDINIETFYNDFQIIIFQIAVLEVAKLNNVVEGLARERKHAEFRAKKALELLPQPVEDSFYLDEHFTVVEHVKKSKAILKRSGLL